MRYAIIENELVINIIVAEQDFIDAHCPDAIECNDGVNIGHIYKDNNFIAPPPVIMPPDETISE
jgi:hypothetical protein